MKRWLTDWRSLLAVSAAVLVGLLAALVVTSINQPDAALRLAKRVAANEQAQRAVLNRRIEQLLAQVSDLEANARADAQQLAALRRELSLLQQQVRDFGGQPVISASGDPSPPPRSSPSASAHPTSSPSHSPTPKPSPSPSRTCVLIVCTGGPNAGRPVGAAATDLRLLLAASRPGHWRAAP